MKTNKKLRNNNIDKLLIMKIQSLIEDETWKEEIIEVLSDTEFMDSNFQGFTPEEIEDYLNHRYDYNSKFIFKLNKFLNKEELKSPKGFENLK